MPKHHSSAITMAKDEIRKGTNAGLKEIANNIVEKQTEERKKLLAMHESRQHDHAAMTSSSPERQRMAKD